MPAEELNRSSGNSLGQDGAVGLFTTDQLSQYVLLQDNIRAPWWNQLASKAVQIDRLQSMVMHEEVVDISVKQAHKVLSRYEGK